MCTSWLPLPPPPSPSKSNAQGQLKLLSRELAYYLDPDTGSRLTSWLNPLNNVTVDVVHVSNDPVNNPVFDGLPVVQVAGSTQVSQGAHVHCTHEVTWDRCCPWTFR